MTDSTPTAPDEPMVTDPKKAGVTEQTGGWGTGTPGSSNVEGQKAGSAPASGGAGDADEAAAGSA